MTTKPKLSPMMKQFYDLKAKHPNAFLLFRCGDFYETYEEDAEAASTILGITLTKTKTHNIDGNPVCMAGFPFHALDTYLPKLVRAGKRVAICENIKDTDNISTIYKETNMETTESVKQQFIGIATETIKALSGKLPATLNKRFADAIGSLDFIRLKYNNAARIETDEMDYLLRLAEIGLKQQEKDKQ